MHLDEVLSGHWQASQGDRSPVVGEAPREPLPPDRSRKAGRRSSSALTTAASPAGRIDSVVDYKIDQLSRTFIDFAKPSEVNRRDSRSDGWGKRIVRHKLELGFEREQPSRERDQYCGTLRGVD